MLSRSESSECVRVWFCSTCNSIKQDVFNDSCSHMTIIRFESQLLTTIVHMCWDSLLDCIGLVLHSSTLSIDDIPSAFPLPLTSSTPQPFNHHKYMSIFNPFFQPLEEKGPRRGGGSGSGEGNKGKKPALRFLGTHRLGPSVRLFCSPEVGSDQRVSD